MSYEEIKTAPGMFFCRAHLEEMPLAVRSADPRYCLDCHAIVYAASAEPVTNKPDKEKGVKEAKPAVVPLDTVVTALKPVKEVVDAFIIKARKQDKSISTRAMSNQLKAQGCNVSHMYVKRCIDEINKQKVLQHA